VLEAIGSGCKGVGCKEGVEIGTTVGVGVGSNIGVGVGITVGVGIENDRKRLTAGGNSVRGSTGTTVGCESESSIKISSSTKTSSGASERCRLAPTE
jgi:hypothetical protein